MAQDISIKAAIILAIIIESILYGQYICIAFTLRTFEYFLLTRNLYFLVWNHIVVPDIPAQLRRGCSSHDSRCVLAIPLGYDGVFPCPFNDIASCLSWLIACDRRCQSCMARLHCLGEC